MLCRLCQALRKVIENLLFLGFTKAPAQPTHNHPRTLMMGLPNDPPRQDSSVASPHTGRRTPMTREGHPKITNPKPLLMDMAPVCTECHKMAIVGLWRVNQNVLFDLDVKAPAT